MMWTVSRMEYAAPRRVTFGPDPAAPVLVFTDGACEGTNFSTSTCGAVLWDPMTDTFEFFGFLIPEAVSAAWKAEGSVEQVIAQAELLPVLLSKILWAGVLRDRASIFFVDNSSVMHCLISCHTNTRASRSMLLGISDIDIHLTARPWYARVPSPSNIADDPSRLEFQSLLDSGAIRREPPALSVLNTLKVLERDMCKDFSLDLGWLRVLVPASL